MGCHTTEVQHGPGVQGDTRIGACAINGHRPPGVQSAHEDGRLPGDDLERIAAATDAARFFGFEFKDGARV